MSNRNFYYKSFLVAKTRTATAFDSFASTHSTKYSKYTKLLNTRMLKNPFVMLTGFVLLLAIAFFAGRFLAPASTNRLSVPAPVATQQLNKTFNFPLRDDKGKEVSKVAYTIQSADLQDAFVFQGKLATAVKGRTFLIVNLKVTNPYSKTIQINAKDYIRVKVNGSSEQLAPEIHNDPVEVQADSTKYTRVGMAINDSDKNITLLVGELQGSKTSINLSLAK